eukprot:gnl/MRDRNA2_/MRDRNA2_348979_c0_seq1.p1 gnl/MRDRNA2_/MRDRNA2_348979_c0~~gnl/MRDRNA2_/MRDRNA2_348979_c0_seq1.p1  ORF type:complete len:114 (-),score=4.64 gnl/MRDRNA2_/MRDRNA2_348979_c0_seq1:129-470(-)
MCFLAYVAVTMRMLTVRNSTVKQALCMLALYPLNVIWTYACIVWVYVIPSDWTHSDALYLVSLINEGLGGFLNVLVYWFGARSLSHALLSRNAGSSPQRSSADSLGAPGVSLQ